MNIIKQQIPDAITKIRGNRKRADAESIFKILTSNSATNSNLEDVYDKVQFLISTSKIENRQAKQGLDSFFVIANQI